jgi:hypothetical protein
MMNNTKRVVFMSLLVVMPVFLLSAQRADPDNDWRTRIASPSYGFNIAIFELEYDENDNTETFVMPGVDVRHFNGINVTESGRFYFGYEVGVAVNFYLGGEYSFEIQGEDYTLTDATAATMLLMGKHGYRRSVGDPAEGLGWGLELGLGLMGGAGMIGFEDTDGTYYSHDTEIISPVFEVAGEFSVQTDRDLRFVARLGLMAGASVIDFDDLDTGLDYLSAEAVPVRFTMRAGFVRDY